MNTENSSCHADIRSLDPFFSPKSIAIVGLSRSALEGPNSVFNTLKHFGYDGEINIINPNIPSEVIENLHTSISALPKAVDLVIVVVARNRVIDALKESAEKGIRAAIVITQGFADADEEGARLQNEIVQLTREKNIRVLGPNTIGLSNAFSNFTSSFIEMHNVKLPIGLISQSGLFMMGHNIIGDEPAGFGMAVDIGNASDVGLIDILEYYGQEDKIDVIQCHVEGIEQGREFLTAAERIGKQKPIVIYKSGTSKIGSVAVASHSGAAAGEAEVYQAAFKKSGLVTADTAEELRLLTKAFATYQPPAGNRVAILSFSGGAAIMAMDAMEASGLKLADLSDSTIELVKPFYPDWMEVGNPLDIWMAVAKDFHKTYPKVLEALLNDPGVDSVLCIYPSFSLPKYEPYDSSLHISQLSEKYPEKPVLCWSYGVNVTGFSQGIEKNGSSMVFPSLHDACSTLAKMQEYGEFNRLPIATGKLIDTDFSVASDVLKDARRAGKEYLFHESFEILETCDADIAPWKVVADKKDLVAAGKEVGYPLCMKIISRDVVHKSDSGGVRLNISKKNELLDAYDEMFMAIERSCPGAEIEGVLLQAMIEEGKEIMIGVKNDPAFGQCMVLGAGGIYAEVLNDFAFRLAPLSKQEACAMIDELSYSSILKGVRGEQPCNIEAIADLLVNVSRLVDRFPEIKELDLNPVKVSEARAVIVDARIIL